MHGSQVQCKGCCRRVGNKQKDTTQNTQISTELKTKEHMWVSVGEYFFKE